MLPTGYNMGTEIFQFPGHVVIQNEMIHEVRVIPTDGRPHVSDRIRQWMGDSRGRWEGDTLVVETTNFNGKVGLTRNGNTLLTSPDLKLVERLTRIGPETLRYEATVHDPGTWTRPYSVALPLRLQPDYQAFDTRATRATTRCATSWRASGRRRKRPRAARRLADAAPRAFRHDPRRQAGLAISSACSRVSSMPWTLLACSCAFFTTSSSFAPFRT